MEEEPLPLKSFLSSQRGHYRPLFLRLITQKNTLLLNGGLVKSNYVKESACLILY